MHEDCNSQLWDMPSKYKYFEQWEQVMNYINQKNSILHLLKKVNQEKRLMLTYQSKHYNTNIILMYNITSTIAYECSFLQNHSFIQNNYYKIIMLYNIILASKNNSHELKQKHFVLSKLILLCIPRDAVACASTINSS